MSLYNREELYLKLLSERNHKVKELSRKLFISEPTVRRDIMLLKKKDLVVCVNGNVSLKTLSPDKRIPAFIRDYENMEAKNIIALKATEHIRNGDTIMLDSSTTVYALLPHLTKFNDIFVVTSGAKTSVALSTLGIKHVCTGGMSITESFSFIGPDAERTLKNYNADIAFFSCRGLDEQGFASDNSIYENTIRQIMIEKSKKKFLLCDESKLNKTCLNTICHVDDLDGVICEKNLPEFPKK